MYVNSEAYYFKELKGKNADEIMDAINGLKQEMSDAKLAMEDPAYPLDLAFESRQTGLADTRANFERAKEALAEVGGTYTPTQAELDADAFQESVPAISTLILNIEKPSSFMERRTIVLGDDAHMDVQHPLDEEQTKVTVSLGKLYKSDDLPNMIYNLYLGEWKDHYDQSQYQTTIPNKIEWSLEVCYSDGRDSVMKTGNGVFPFNFDALEELFGIDPSMDVWTTENLSEEDLRFYNCNLERMEEDENERFLLRMSNLESELFDADN